MRTLKVFGTGIEVAWCPSCLSDMTRLVLSGLDELERNEQARVICGECHLHGPPAGLQADDTLCGFKELPMIEQAIRKWNEIGANDRAGQ